MKFYTSVEQKGNKILLLENHHGKKIQTTIDYKPSLFTEDSDGDFKTMFGKPLKKRTFDNISSMREFISTYEGTGFDIYGNNEAKYACLSDLYFGEVKFNFKNIHYAIIDAETTTEHGFPDVSEAIETITVLSYYSSIFKTFFVFTNDEFGEWDPEHFTKDIPVSIKHIPCENEKVLLEKFVSLWIKKYPDIVTGWNIDGFDIPYIINRITRVLGAETAKALSPWNIINETKKKNKFGESVLRYSIFGVAILDFMALYKKFRLINRPSYKLDYICDIELKTGKLDHSEYETFKDFYEQDYEKFVSYNVKDVWLVLQLDMKFSYIELAVTIAYYAHSNYEDVLGSVKVWENLIFNHFRELKVAIPMKNGSAKGEYEGAFVYDVKEGLNDWVVFFDLASLYPHVIMQYKISPENITSLKRQSFDMMKLIDLKEDVKFPDNHCVTANGYTYKNDGNAVLPYLMEKIYNERKAHQKLKKQYQKGTNEFQHHDSFQYALKILINSLYGCLGCAYFRYYDLRNAEATTLTGQMTNRFIVKRLNTLINKVSKTEDVNYIVAGDTDSGGFSFGKFVELYCKGKSKDEIVDFLDKFINEKMYPYIDKCYDQLAEKMGCTRNYMNLEREAIADRAFWKAKKMYVMNVLDMEGERYKTPELKIKGMQSVRSTVPDFVSDQLEEIYRTIVTKDFNQIKSEVVNILDSTRKDFMSRPLDEIASTSSVKGLQTYSGSDTIYIKGTPIHVRASLLYNKYVVDKGLDMKYPLIRNGDKIKYMYMKRPNEINENVIAFPTRFPEEIVSSRYIDKRLQFEKVCENDVEEILKILGLTIEESLDDL